MFQIYRSERFEDEFQRLEKVEQLRVSKFIEQLKLHGHEVGQKLGGRTYFREKKFDGKRLYYLIYLPWNCILLVGMSNKKNQQETIDEIVRRLEYYKEFVGRIHFREN